MSIKDSFMTFVNKMRQGPVVTDGPEPNMANGGHTGYHPPVQPRKPLHEQPPMMQNTGFSQTGYDPNFYQNTGFQQNYSGNAYPEQNTSYQNGGFQAAGFGQTGFQGTGFAQTGYQNGMGQQQTGFQAGGFQQGAGFRQQATGFQNSWAQQAQQPLDERPRTWGFQQVPEQQAQAGRHAAPDAPYQTEGNVTYAFGQQFKSEQGVAYNHVERLAQPLSVASCFRLIEFMRNGESIVVNLELVSDESERTRCLDMLYGAAFTMQCSFTRVASRCIYLIAPHTVLVEPYESIRAMSEKDADDRWGKNGTSGELRTDVRWRSRQNQEQKNADYEERRYSYR